MIPFLDLARQYQVLQDEIEPVLHQSLARGRYILGDEVSAFEAEFAAFCGARHAIGVASGTDALRLALLACGVGPGDEVITAPNSAVATAMAICLTGAEPRFADVDAESFNLDPAALAGVITPKTRAIVPVHLYGQPADMRRILDVARSHRLAVVEDACQAHGATYDGRSVGTLGDAGCFSFYPTKNLGAYGDGGAVITNDDALAERIRGARNYGWSEHSISMALGMNSRLDELQAALLRVKLRHLPKWTAARRARADRYRRLLASSGVIPPAAACGDHVYHLFVVRSGKRDDLRQSLAERGVQTMIHYPMLIPYQPAFAWLGYPAGSFPVAEKLTGEILSLPLYPELNDDEQEAVAAGIMVFAGKA